MPHSPPSIRVPSPGPDSATHAPRATPARPVALDDLLAPTPTPALLSQPTTPRPSSMVALSPSADAAHPRSAASLSDSSCFVGPSPGLCAGRMLASPSFAPEMRLSASHASAPASATAASRSPAPPASRAHSPTDRPHPRSPSTYRFVPSPPALTRAALNYPHSKPDSPPCLDTKSKPSRLPGLGALLNTSGTTRHHSASSFVPYVPHAAEPATAYEVGRAPTTDLVGLGMVIDAHERQSNSPPCVQQPPAPRIGASDDGRFGSVVGPDSPGQDQQTEPTQPHAYPSSLTVLNTAPSSFMCGPPRSGSGTTPTFPRVTGLTGLGIALEETHQSSVPPPSVFGPNTQHNVHDLPPRNTQPNPNAIRSAGFLAPAAADADSPANMGAGLPVPSLSVRCPSNGLSPVLDRVHLSGGSPHSSVGSMALSSPSEETTPVYSIASLPDESQISRSFEAVQATVPSSSSTASGLARPTSYRELCKARSAALVQTTASAFEAHRSPSRRARGPPSDAPIPPGAEDSPWGVFSLNPKKVGGWRPVFPPGIRPPVPGGVQPDRPDEPSPPKRARTSRAAAPKTTPPQAKTRARASAAKTGAGKGKSEGTPKTRAPPALSLKNANRMR